MFGEEHQSQPLDLSVTEPTDEKEATLADILTELREVRAELVRLREQVALPREPQWTA